MATKRKCTTLSLAEKKRVIDAVEKGGKKKSEIAKEFGIPNSTLSTILKNKDTILKNFDDHHGDRKKMRSGDYPDVEKCLMKWMTQCRTQNFPLGGNILREKAEDFGKQLGYTEFKASSGWFENFKKRNNVSFHKICGESGSVTEDVCQEWVKTLSPILKQYDPKNVFNADETGLFFKCLPDKTMSIKGEPCHGGKRSKERVTLLLCSNMDGSEKLKPVMIGKSKKPRCFAGIKSFPMDYECNKKAWMTAVLFEKWLKELEKKMKRQKRKIVLFIDNCTAHPSTVTSQLKFVRVEFMPPNTTSKLQPLDQGIIQNFKVKYRHEVVKKCIAEIDGGTNPSVNLLEAMRMAYKAWNCVEQKTIANCFRKARFVIAEDEAGQPDEEEEIESLKESVEEEWRLISNSLHLDSGTTFQDFVDVDNNVEICGNLTDKEILEEIRSPSEEEDNDDEEFVPPKRITFKEAESAMDVMRAFIESRSGMTTKTFQAIALLENVLDAERTSNAYQTVLDRYLI